jgi:hypothetical protein
MVGLLGSGSIVIASDLIASDSTGLIVGVLDNSDTVVRSGGF